LTRGYGIGQGCVWTRLLQRRHFVKILYHHRIRSKDGQAVHLEELIESLRGLGHEVLLVGPDAFERASFGHDPKFLSAMKKLIPRFVYESLEIGYNARAYIRLRRACDLFRPDVIYERYNLYSLAGVWCRKRARLPLLLEVNAPLARERASFGGLGFPALARQLERWVWRNADSVLPVSHVLANEIRAAGAEAERITIIPNGVRPESFPADGDDAVNQQLKLHGKIVLGFAGFVRDWHGLDSVVDLLAGSGVPSNLHFLVIGDGPALIPLKKQVEDLGVSDRVTFAGLVDRDRLPHYIAAFDIALLPRCVEYCSPLKLFEYMAAGKAIVAPAQENVCEILQDEISGILFSAEDREAMTRAILRLASDAALRDGLGRAARQLISSKGYTWYRNAERVSAIAASLVANPGRNIANAAP
jgi:glycosyltransferase involved in cell wall biosynthesis